MEEYPIYEAKAYADLLDDRVWLEEIAVAAGFADGAIPGTPGFEDVITSDRFRDFVMEEASRCRYDDLDLEVVTIDGRIRERVRETRPEWPGGSYELMVRGTAGRWDGVSHGHQYYRGPAAFSDLIADTGHDGLLRDCEIDRIWEDRTGTVHVEASHHDGRVSVACRAVAPGTEEAELELPSREAAGFADAAWDGGVTADVAGYYGAEWPGDSRLDALEAECSAPGREAPGACRDRDER